MDVLQHRGIANLVKQLYVPINTSQRNNISLLKKKNKEAKIEDETKDEIENKQEVLQ